MQSIFNRGFKLNNQESEIIKEIKEIEEHEEKMNIINIVYFGVCGEQ